MACLLLSLFNRVERKTKKVDLRRGALPLTGMRTSVLVAASVVVGALAAMGCTTGEAGAGAGPGSQSAQAGTGNVAAAGAAGSDTTAVTPDCTTDAPSPRILRQLTRNEYKNTVTALLGIADPDVSAIPPDRTLRGFTTNVTVAFVTPAHMDAYMSVGSALASRAVKEAFAAIVPCATQDNACASQFIDKFGTRAFRRPLSADEKARYAKLFDTALTGGDFKVGVELTLRSLLVSPNFLFRTELGTDAGGGRFVLTQYEIASALSYTFWGTMPDDALFAAAASGALSQKAEIETQARRLLADERGRRNVANFFYEWLESPRAYIADKDATAFPNLYSAAAGVDAIRDAMRAEQDAFVTNVVFDSTKKFKELFTADYTFVNDRLASFYGLPLAGGGEVAKKLVLPANSARGGLLTLGMFLFGHARTTQSSPTQRGHMIRANILCQDIPPPPPDVDATVQPGTPGKTARQQILALTGSGACPACHRLQDPIGFGLEGFDGVGDPRTVDNGEPVDTSGQINGMSSPSDPPIPFNGAKELASIIANSGQARKCMVTNYYRYARGFDAKGIDTCAVNQLSRALIESDEDLGELFIAVALQDSFVTRRSTEIVKQ